MSRVRLQLLLITSILLLASILILQSTNIGVQAETAVTPTLYASAWNYLPVAIGYNQGPTVTATLPRPTLTPLPTNTPEPGRLASPTLFDILNYDNDGSFAVGWSSIPDAEYYRLQEKRDNGNWAQIYEGPQREFARSNLSDGQYCYRVMALNATSDSEWSATKCATVASATSTLEPTASPGLEAPVIFDIDNADGDGDYAVEWTSVADAEQYIVREGYNDAVDWDLVYRGPKLSLSRTNMPAAEYCYRVRGIIEGGEWGPWSEVKCTSVTSPTSMDRAALIALYQSTNGDEWTTSDGWLGPDDHCNWHGVYCLDGRVTGPVTELWLFNNQLSGPIPKELGNLSDLQLLYLGENQLNGSIPKELGNLSDLRELRLDRNQLSGSIPPELGNLSSLSVLYLFGNQLNDPIPKELGNLSDLLYLDLSYNGLSGPIPKELGNLSSLRRLLLDNNLLNGPIPKELGNLSDLRGLWLYENQLSGPIPKELGNLSNLGWFYLYENQLSGSIPPELGNLSDLETLSLHNNQLSGPIPKELGNLSSLRDLSLRNNQLAGPIPKELGNLSSLDNLRLDNNLLSGPIPKELGNLSDLWGLWMINNQLSCWETSGVLEWAQKFPSHHWDYPTPGETICP